MRDPYSPILPQGTEKLRDRPGPPPLPVPRERFDPLRCLTARDSGSDPLGIDRRSRARTNPEGQHAAEQHWDQHGTRSLVAATHRSFEAVMAIVSGRRWAWVDLLSVAPDGLLVRSLEVVDAHCSTAAKRRLRAAMPQLSNALGSSLAMVGASLLGPSLMHGLASWGQRSGSSSSAASVRVAIAPADRGLPAYFVEGELHALIDPDESVVAVRLAREDVASVIEALTYP